MIRIAVCEDEQILLEQLTDDIKNILNKHSVIYSVKAYANGNALLAHKEFDILFLDIAMQPITGLELAKRLRARGDESKMVFITAHRQYAIDAYDVQAFHYLIKPVDLKKLEAILLKLCSLLKGEYDQALSVCQGTMRRRIPFEQILYLEVINRKIYLHKNNESVPFYGKLNEIEPMLPDSFFRCHRSYIVNFDHVKYYKKETIWLDNEYTVPLSRRRHQAFGLAFMYYLKKGEMSFECFNNMGNRLGNFLNFLSISLFKRNAWSKVSLYLSLVLYGKLAIWTHECMVRYCRHCVGKYDLFMRLCIYSEYTAVSWKYHKKGFLYSVDVWDSGSGKRYILPTVYGCSRFNRAGRLS